MGWVLTLTAAAVALIIATLSRRAARGLMAVDQMEEEVGRTRKDRRRNERLATARRTQRAHLHLTARRATMVAAVIPGVYVTGLLVAHAHAYVVLAVFGIEVVAIAILWWRLCRRVTAQDA